MISCPVQHGPQLHELTSLDPDHTAGFDKYQVTNGGYELHVGLSTTQDGQDSREVCERERKSAKATGKYNTSAASERCYTLRGR